MSDEPKVDLIFRVTGKRVPVDHGYALYAAICRVLPELHDDGAAGLGRLRGRFVGTGLLDISPSTDLILRIPTGRISAYLPLAGRHLDVTGNTICVGVPHARALVPVAALYAHLVTTRNGNDQSRFEEEIRRQADALAVRGRLTIGERRTFQVHNKQVVGFSVLASELTAEESIALQDSGLGGRRKMGCGFFEVPT